MDTRLKFAAHYVCSGCRPGSHCWKSRHKPSLGTLALRAFRHKDKRDFVTLDELETLIETG
jgi:hypothetical protein